MKKLINLVLGCAIAPMLLAQSQSQRQSPVQIFQQFRENLEQNYNNFRSDINRRYAEHMQAAWQYFEASTPIQPLRLNPIPFELQNTPQTPDIDPVSDSVSLPSPVQDLQPEPEPIAEPQPQPSPLRESIDFTFLGRNVRMHKPSVPAHVRCDERGAAEAWRHISDNSDNENTLESLTQLRSELDLCDWAYKLLVDDAVAALPNLEEDASTLFKTWLLAQSGYSVRVGSANGKLRMLIGTRYQFYNLPYYIISGLNFFPDPAAADNSVESMHIFDMAFPDERPFDMLVDRLPRCTMPQDGTNRSAQSSELTLSPKVDGSVIQFFSRYRTCQYGTDYMSRWAMMVRTPFSEPASHTIITYLRQQTAGLSESDGIALVLNLVQTGFEYRTDEEVWGHDRAFFPEETVLYPYSDCEDRAILFARLVKELYGRPVALLYYTDNPHIGTAVCFSEQLPGDTISIRGRQFTICDPTYANADIGMTMPGMNNATAMTTVIE